MNDQFEWKAEITFKGTAEEFNEMSASLGEVLKAKYVAVSIPGVKWPDTSGGRFPFPRPFPDEFSERMNRAKITDGMPEVSIKYLKDICGGIRTPHYHVGDKVVLLDRARFKVLVGELARELAISHVDLTEDHVEVMNHIGRLAESNELYNRNR
jgi:hypothetical protein